MESPLPTSPSQSGDSFTSGSSFPSPASYSSAPDGRSSDIAIIGFSLELPGASSTEAFWDLMLEGRCVASKFPPSRINGARYRGVGGSNVPRKASFLERDVGTFDAKFFGMTADETGATDPQQRILLETTYRALENAGITMQAVSGSNTSVHTGCFTADYLLMNAKDTENSPRYAATGMANSMLSNKISTFFNLNGSSVTIDTACSSSLVALDMACKGLALGESSMGIVAGCNLLLSTEFFYSLSRLGFLSPDGVCHSFDSRANGYGRAEGFGVLIVKRLDTALRDGDTIRAVIRATGTNQNGYTPLAVPSKDLQTRLIKDTYQRAGLLLSKTKYFEAHGTGTAIGDPLEAMAIGNTFGPERDKDDPIIVGALKASIGHLEGAAGIAGVIKTVMILERGIIPPIAELGSLNKTIDAEFLKLEFPRIAQPWKGAGLRRASVNSFGFGGTNAHAVLDDAFHYLESRGLSGKHCTRTSLETQTIPLLPTALVQHGRSEAVSKLRLFVWSAQSRDSAANMIDAYRTHLSLKSGDDQIGESYLDDLSYTLAHRRTHHAWRTFAVAESLPELVEQLSASQSPVQTKLSPRLGFVFTGQGAQWAGMGRELYSYPVFWSSILEATKFLQSIGCTWKASEIFRGTSTFEARMNEPQFAQPLCTILQVALIELLISMGIHPAVVVGHSSGEIAAAYAAGAICQQSAWKLAYYRGLFSSQLTESPGSEGPRGSMMAVGLSESEANRYIREILEGQPSGVLVVACINSPKNTTLSGDEDLILSLQKTLEADGVFARVLKVPVAYHSPHMQRVAASYEHLIGTLHPRETSSRYVSMVSSVTGEAIAANDLRKPEYWVRNLVSPVRFAHAIEQICQNSAKERRKKLDLSHRNFVGISDILEIGPHSTLQGPIRETVDAAKTPSKVNISYAAVLIRGRAADRTLLEAAGKLHSQGIALDLTRVASASHLSKQSFMSLPTLPGYVYDHSSTYWDESRLSKNSRLHAQIHSELLGVPVPDWNPLQPRWRKTLKLSSLPWLQDHRVNGEILFPAAGMLVMAIEAITQILSNQEIASYEIRDTDILSAVTIPQDDKGVEVQFQLQPTVNDTTKSISSAKFSLFAIRSDNSFFKVCRGEIRVSFASTTPGNPSSSPEEKVNGIAFGDKRCVNLQNRIASAIATYNSEISGEELYKIFEANGYNYGPLFQGIEHARRNSSGQALADVAISIPPATHEFITSVVHPCTLDTLLQSTLPALVHGSSTNNGLPGTWIPSHVSKMWISSSGFEESPSGSVQVHVSTEPQSGRLCVASMEVMGPSSGSPARVLHAEGMELTLVSSELPSRESRLAQSQVNRLCYDMVYKPDLTLLSTEQAVAYARDSGRSAIAEDSHCSNTLALYAIVCIARVLASVGQSEIPADRPQLHSQFSWMQRRLAAAMDESSRLAEEVESYLDDTPFAELCGRVRETSRLGQIYEYFGAHLASVLRGEVDALEVLAEDGRLQEYYQLSEEGKEFYQPFQRYLDALMHKNPGMSILEVGAGSGTTTRHAMNTLVMQTPNSPFLRFARYDFTDVEPLSLEAVQKVYGGWDKMQFRLLDIDNDPVEQGYEEGLYDVVIATNVVNAKTSLSHSLGNIRRLMRENGKLILVNNTAQSSAISQLIFGFLPGPQQIQETARQQALEMSISQWTQELEIAGFTGADAVLEDLSQSDDLTSHLIISSAAPLLTAEKPAIKHSIFLVTGWDRPSHESPTANLVAAKLEDLGATDIRWSSFTDAASQLEDEELSAHEPLVLIVQDQRWLALESLDASQYLAFNATLSRPRGTLWLVNELAEDGVMPTGAEQGLARTLRAEAYGRVFANVTLDPTSSPSVLSGLVEKSLSNFLRGVQGAADYERELIQVGDALHIPRVYERNALNQSVHDATLLEPVEREQPFGKQNLKLKVRHPGLIDSLYFEEVPAWDEPLAPNEIELDVKAVGVNFRDCLIALGRVDQKEFGTDCSGVVTSVGSDCNSLKPGDRVLVSAIDTFKGSMRCNELLAIKIPDDMTFVDAGALPTIFVTAWHALVRIGRLAAGESILIHSGAGGTGQAAIQIAQWCGAEVFTTVGSAAKKRLLTEVYGIPPERILNSRDLSFADEIKLLTNNKGVDVVLNSLAGDALVASWECIAPFGRFLEIGKKDIFSHNKLPMFPFGKNVSYSGVDLTAIMRDRPELVQEALREIIGLFSKKALRVPEQRKLFPISEVEQAFRYLQTGTNAGKVVVEVDPSQTVRAFVRPKPEEWAFDVRATYVIAGGLGAQGREIASWMVRKGAKNLVLLSRAGPKPGSSAEEFVDSLRSKGVNVFAPPCDISSLTSVSAMVDRCKANMPPIKGCIQAAMDLRDSIFENMSYDAWSSSLKPKIHGSWNLHRQLPDNLDFFVMLSSIAGVIGSQGQSNYAVGNVFQDSLAQYRLSRGQRAFSLNFSMMAGHGFAVEQRDAAMQFVKTKQVMEMTQPEILAVLDHVCNKDIDPTEALHGQIVMGLELPADIVNRGMDPSAWAQEPIFANLHQIQPFLADDAHNDSQEGKKGSADLARMVESAASAAEAAEIVAEMLTSKLCRTLSLTPDTFEADQPLHVYGIDSLIAVELRNWFLQTLKVDVAVFEIMSGATTRTLAQTAAEKLKA